MLKNEMLVFGLHLTSDDRLGWLMDSNPICHPSPAKKMKCLFLDYIQLLMIGRAGRWTRTPSATPLQPRNEMLIFGLCSTSDDQLSDLSDESRLKCEKRPPKTSQDEMLVFGLHSTSDDWLSNPSNESQPKCDKRPPKSSNNEMLIFGLHSTSDDWPSDPSDES